MPTFNAALFREVRSWADAAGVTAPVEELSLDEMKEASRALNVSLDDVLAMRDALVSDAAADIADAGARTAADRDAAGGAAAGFGGSPLDSSPAFGRFAFDVVGGARDTNGPEPLVKLDPDFRTFGLVEEAPLSIAHIAGVEVERAQLMRFDGVRNTFLHKSALTTAEVSLGKLSQGEFDKVHAAMGGKSSVGFDPGREYNLTDFLPPAIQALVNQDLQPGQGVTLVGTDHFPDDTLMMPYGADKSVDVTANCHSTAYEAVRAFQGDRASVDIFYGDATQMDSVAFESFDSLRELDGADAAQKLAELELKPGDLVQYTDTGGYNLLHSATYVGGGLFFEKPDTESREEDAPYRLATAETMTTPVDDFAAGEFKVRVLRAKQALKPAAEQFRSMNADVVEEWAKDRGRAIGVPLVDVVERGMGGGFLGAYLSGLVTIPLQKDASGRASLDDD